MSTPTLRFLTEDEVNTILKDFETKFKNRPRYKYLPSVEGAPLNDILDLMREQLSMIKTFPNLIPYYSELYFNKYEQARIENTLSKRVGVAAATATTQNISQTAFKSFQSAGVKSKVAGTMTDIIQLLKATSVRKNPLCYISFAPKEGVKIDADYIFSLQDKIVYKSLDNLMITYDIIDVDEVQTVSIKYGGKTHKKIVPSNSFKSEDQDSPDNNFAARYLAITGEDIIKKPEDMASCYLRVYFSMNQMLLNKIYPEHIIHAVRNKIATSTAIPGPFDENFAFMLSDEIHQSGEFGYVMEFYESFKVITKHLKNAVSVSSKIQTYNQLISNIYFKNFFVPKFSEIYLTGIPEIEELIPVDKPLLSFITKEYRINDTVYRLYLNTFEAVVGGIDIDYIIELIKLFPDDIELLESTDEYLDVRFVPTDDIVVKTRRGDSIYNFISKQTKDQPPTIYTGVAVGTASLTDLFKLEEVDPYNTYTNNILDILHTLDIDAVRNFIVMEKQKLLKANGNTIDPGHIIMIADYMTHKSSITSFKFQGIMGNIYDLEAEEELPEERQDDEFNDEAEEEPAEADEEPEDEVEEPEVEEPEDEVEEPEELEDEVSKSVSEDEESEDEMEIGDVPAENVKIEFKPRPSNKSASVVNAAGFERTGEVMRWAQFSIQEPANATPDTANIVGVKDVKDQPINPITRETAQKSISTSMMSSEEVKAQLLRFTTSGRSMVTKTAIENIVGLNSLTRVVGTSKPIGIPDLRKIPAGPVTEVEVVPILAVNEIMKTGAEVIKSMPVFDIPQTVTVAQTEREYTDEPLPTTLPFDD